MYDVITPQQTLSQPDFKYWLKLYNEVTKEISDLYFMSDDPAVVICNGKAVVVNPATFSDLYEEGLFHIYYVTSK